MGVVFDKYEGLGNDFVVVQADEPMAPGAAIRICDRHFGVGADGVLVVTPPATDGARCRMIVLNADGSQPEMCGNGLRCVGLHLARVDRTSSADYTIETDAGLRGCRVLRDGDAGVATIDMGTAEPLGEHRITLDSQSQVFDLVSMGNPHAVLVGAVGDADLLDRWGPQVSRSIEGGANVELVAVRSATECSVLVWERGVGRTLACGTGAAASVVALAKHGLAPFGRAVRVHLPGGALEITVEDGSLAVELEGPARRVFGGELAI